ncbi:hypothetical protein [Microbacterium sp. Cr-K29]|uniref:hypothetical protein n=1 Tax=Microbacterium sp. Cr-K29 TaxID=1452534 RepID=UPI0004933FE7|nr:hypothetical protein [Microbacterium sp. Cr-K29]
MGKFGQTASELGRPFLVSGDVMNVALRNAGILEGEPGEWRITAAGERWVNERDFTNGRHPDAHQNPYFTVRQFDPEMVEALGITAEDVAAAKLEVTTKRAAQSAQFKADRVQADAEFLASQNPPAADVDSGGRRIEPRTAIVVVAVVAGVAVTAYLIIKHVPPVRRRWDEKVAPRLARWAERRRGDRTENDPEK